MKKKLSLFARIYIIVMTVLLIALVSAACLLWDYLKHFEATRSKYPAEEVFNKYFVASDIDALFDDVDIPLNKFDTPEQISSLIEAEISDAELEYFLVSTESDGSQKYVVTANDRRISYFTLSQSKKAGKYGMKPFKLSSVEFFTSSEVDATITAPTDYSVKINGVSLDDSFIKESGIKHKTYDYMPEGVKGVTMTVYHIDGLCDKPDVKVFTPDGNEVLGEELENGEYIFDLFYSDKLKKEQSDYAVKFTETYALVMSDDKPKSEVYKYVVKNSEFYKKIEFINLDWVLPHDRYTITDQESSEFYQHSDEVFSCRVKLTRTVYDGSRKKDEYIDLVIYFKKVNGKYLVYNAVTDG